MNQQRAHPLSRPSVPIEMSGAPANAPRELPDTLICQVLRAKRIEIRELAASGGVSTVRVFDSVARGTDRVDSDVDFLVDLVPCVTLLAIIGLERDLPGLVGRRVEIIPARSLKPALVATVTGEATAL